MAQLLYPECDCILCRDPIREDIMRISVRVKALRTIIREEDVSGFLGPTWVMRWIIRQANSVGLVAGEYEYRIGKTGVWTS